MIVEERLSLFREKVRLSGRHKCHSVRLPWYQMMTSRVPSEVVVSVGPQRPGISSRWPCGFPTPARSLAATSPCAGLSASPSISPSQGTSACAERWLWACRRWLRCRCCPLDPSRSRPLRVLRGNREALVEPRQELLQHPVGFPDAARPRQPEFSYQPVLERSRRALHPALGLG